jgi:outer membrane protein assembly factor BamB
MYARSVRPCADGGYIVAASTLLLKTDSLGDTAWTRPLSAEDVEPLPDGGYILCGDSDGPSLTRTDSLGNVQWKRAYGRFPCCASAVSVMPDGGYVLTGFVWSETCADSVYLAKTTSDGYLVWARTCYGLRGTDGLDVALSSDGGYYVAGITDELSSPYLAGFDADGKMKWQRELSPQWGQGSSVLPTSDNGCIVAGSDGDGAVLFKVDQDGGMTPEFRQLSPRHGPRVAHDLAGMRRRRPGLRKED